MRRTDRAIGIALGLVGGLAAVIVFVFVGSEETIDEATLGGEEAARDLGRGAGERGVVPAVRIIGGQPIEVVRLTAAEGERVRFRARSDTAVAIEVQGYGVTEEVPAGGSALVAFRASRPGDFPIVIAASQIAVASLRVERTR